MSIYEKLIATEIVVLITCIFLASATTKKTPDWLQAVGGLVALVTFCALPITILAEVWCG